ncbi:molecular chaperone HtpG [Gloeobacter violaceus]|uniref:Heat shock protein n=1 Tax=Gloeobacter violaceus (strain ATCC 29082 / PCC 7421) TaxID=251221 RepID=Q7NJL8_GLOVI|nr:molecular chaperone HtpG [Gloeobacter violaceus]BAC89755.1 heat shock protein [Gloeobacter violaceus PCC 7421]
MQERGSITVHTENIFPIIKRWLYSDKDIFLRELISNAADAISKLKMLGYSGEFHNSGEEFEIHVTLDKEAKTLSVTDNGIGMTAEEVKKYINQVAFSSAEEFLQKYQGDDVKQQIIGHFGLGFYSAFMVAGKVEIDTLSYKSGAEAVLWSCDGTTAFELTSSGRTERGTTVRLLIDTENEEFLDEVKVRQLIRNYCDFLPVPIKFNGEAANRQKPLWTQSPSSLKDEDYKEFYSYLYPLDDEPLFWIHLNTDYPFNLQGILYFPRLRSDIDWTKGQIRLFCNQVFVSNNVEEIIPQFLTPLQGAVDSPDIPLNVSRSFLQNDRTVRRIADYITKKVGDRLKELHRDDYERYVQCWKDINMFIKYGVMNSDKFYEQVKDILIFPVALGESYTTLKDYLEHNKEKTGGKVYYASDTGAQAPYIELLKSQDIEVLLLDAYIDTHFVSFLERHNSEARFARVDSDLDENVLSKDKAAELVDPATNKTRSEQLVELFQRQLGQAKLKVRAEALKSEATPAVLLLPESLRRIKEMTALVQQKPMEFLDDHTLVLNTSNPLIQNVQRLADTGRDDALVTLVCQHVYDLALLSQKSFDAAAMGQFIQRSNDVLTRLSNRAVE